MKSLAPVKRTTLNVVRVFRSPLHRSRGVMAAGPVRMACALGRAGLTHNKREGDGGTPVGSFRLLGATFRADHVPRPLTHLRLRVTRPQDGWCDDPADRRYNRPLRLPDLSRHECLWRNDGLYDIVLDIAANRGPIRKGRGSAIFFHVAREGYGPTEGCVALRRTDLARLLPRLGPRTRVVVR